MRPKAFVLARFFFLAACFSGGVGAQTAVPPIIRPGMNIRVMVGGDQSSLLETAILRQLRDLRVIPNPRASFILSVAAREITLNGRPVGILTLSGIAIDGGQHLRDYLMQAPSGDVEGAAKGIVHAVLLGRPVETTFAPRLAPAWPAPEYQDNARSRVESPLSRQPFNENHFLDRVIREEAATVRLLDESYRYRKTLIVEEMTLAGVMGGRHEKTWDVLRVKGQLYQRSVVTPRTTMSLLHMTAEDVHDLWKIQAFFLPDTARSEYRFRYMGSESLNDRQTHVFEISPLRFVGKRRYLRGKIWVDRDDAQIIKLSGQGVGYAARGANNELQCFPEFETFRERADNVENRWVPIRTVADHACPTARLRLFIDWTGYKRMMRDEVNSVISSGTDSGQYQVIDTDLK